MKKGDKILVCDSMADWKDGNFTERIFVVFHEGKSFCEEEDSICILRGWEYAKSTPTKIT